MKVCSKCKTSKDESEYFFKNKKINRLHAQCKSCYKLHRQGYYTEHYNKYRDQYLLRGKKRREKMRFEFRSNMLEYLSNKACLDCGENDIRVLELDHISPKNKKFTISQSVKLGYSWSKVKLELKKCRILCANCHKRRTAQQFGWYKAL